jgi:hypothetical protein
MITFARSASLPKIVAGAAIIAMTACDDASDSASFSVEIYPSTPEAQVDNLMCVVTNLPDGMELSSLQVLWMVDGQDYATASGSSWSGPFTTVLKDDTVPAVDVYAGQDWLCYVENDGTLTVGVVDIPMNGDEDLAVEIGSAGGDESSAAEINVPEVAGTWTLAEPISYSCAIEDWFQFSLENMYIDQDGKWLWIETNDGQHGTLAGSVSTHNSIYAEHYIEGSCTERYQLDVRLTDSGTMEGSFTATFFGSGCYDCSLQSWDITATRR